MHRLVFLSRVALVCNLCFAFSALLVPRAPGNLSALASTVVILGRIVAPLLNALLLAIFAGIMIAGRPLFQHLPRWLFWINLLFFVAQVIFLVS